MSILFMLMGIGLIGAFTGLVASYFIEEDEEELFSEVARIHDRLDRIEAALGVEGESRRLSLKGAGPREGTPPPSGSGPHGTIGWHWTRISVPSTMRSLFQTDTWISSRALAIGWP